PPEGRGDRARVRPPQLPIFGSTTGIAGGAVIASFGRRDQLRCPLYHRDSQGRSDSHALGARIRPAALADFRPRGCGFPAGVEMRRDVLLAREQRPHRLVDAAAVGRGHRAADALASEPCAFEHAFGRAVADLDVGDYATDAEIERMLCERTCRL